MINLTDKAKCTGCEACATACPRKAITMIADGEGFYYPEVANDFCVGCGLCDRVCHELHPMPVRCPEEVYAAINKDENIRLNSSSGGMFYLLAEKTIQDGGVVFGARFDERWQVVVDYAETTEEVTAFMGAKYVQAKMGKAYGEARRFLDSGRKVLFSGTPCQLAGLHRFLGKRYDNLLSVDLICHGVPSPKVWRMYLDEVSGRDGQVRSVSFRDKSAGWTDFSVSIQAENVSGTFSLSDKHDRNQYMRAFLADLILRPSCHDCVVKSGRSHSDLTLGDFWGIGNVDPKMYDDKGTSMVFVNSDAGKQAMPPVESTEYSLSDYSVAERYNTACSHSVRPHPRRTSFFRNLDKKSESVSALIEKALEPTFNESFILPVKRFAHRFLSKFRRKRL